MNANRLTRPLRRTACALGLMGLLLGAATARAQANPDFDAVPWTPIGCPAADLTADASPRSVNFVGDPTYPAAYYAFDTTYLYFRYRMDGTPGSFDQFNWTALMQVPSGNPFQYQYQVTLNGQSETIELWQNTVASDIDFSPLFHDEAEVKLFSQPYDLADGSTVNTTPLARSLPTGDGSSFGGGPDYFVDFAIPVAALVTHGVVASAPEIGGAVFFPATSTNPNNYNKGYLNCPFLPVTEVTVDKTVDPSQMLANATTPLTFTIAATNTGGSPGRGLVLEDIALPAWMTNVAAAVSADDPSVTWTVMSTNPLVVRIPVLPIGKTLSVALTADAAPTCAHVATDFLNVVGLSATNAMDDAATALVDVTTGAEVCDGMDNDCNGSADENPTALCDDADACNGAEACGGAAGCQPGTPPVCDDANACTVESCDPALGCVNTPTPGCVPCAVDADCNDGDACSADSCTAGICGSAPIPGCIPCTTDGDCNDGDVCTTDTCSAGACAATPVSGCVPCAVDAECNDGNACTTDACTAGVCATTSIPGCVPCSTAADCNDGDACTTDACTAGVCGATATPGCVRCTTAADCADQDECTTETCAAGACAVTQVSGCPIPVEECQNGTDDDGDGLVDCGDPDCASEPACQQEVCGDCLDNDGDGLVDYEDTDCCADPMALGVSRMMLKPAGPKKVRGKTMRLKARYASFTPALFDPMHADTTLQVADDAGQLFCQTISSTKWKHPRARSYKFRDKRGSFAGGLKAGRFKVKRDGSIVFRTAGKKVRLRSTGSQVRVTLRVGDQCSQSTTTLRAKRKALVFP